MILFSSSNAILTSAKVLPGHVCQHTFQKAMALHNIVFTVVNNWLFPKLSGARNQVGESVRPKGGSRGPSNQNGCGAPGNSTQVVQVGLHPQKCFLPVLPLPLSARVRALVPTVRLTVWKRGRADWPFSCPGSVAHCRPDPYCPPHRHRRQVAEYRRSERLPL